MCDVPDETGTGFENACVEFGCGNSPTSHATSRSGSIRLGELFGTMGERVGVEPPVRVAYGRNLHLGDDVQVSFGLTVVDDGEVHVGDRAMFAPHVSITATGRPVHPELRRVGSQFSAPVRIEDDAGIGAGAVLLAGVVVGRGSVVGAGTVVTSNVPPKVVVAGFPARIVRHITDADRQFRYRPPRDRMLDLPEAAQSET